MLKSYQLQQRAADHDIYAKIMEQWIQLNYVVLKKVIQGLKPRIFNKLNKFGRRWLTELPSVIWSLRTTPSRATGFSPFFLVYGAEAILPTDLEYGSPRLKAYQEQQNQRAREDSLDQVDEARDVALLHSARYQ